jgi:hypothetical protein
MNQILQLQKLPPTAVTVNMNIVLMSTYSGICPTNATNLDTLRFEME